MARNLGCPLSALAAVVTLVAGPELFLGVDREKFDAIEEFYKWYPDVPPNAMLAKIRQNPKLVTGMLASGRPERDRFAAYYLLVESRAEGFRQRIVQGLSDGSAKIREMAVVRLPDACSGEELIDKYVARLKDKDDMVRYRAAEGLCEHPSQRALDPLFNCFSDDSIEVRGGASYALFKWDLPGIRKRLRVMLKSPDVVVGGSAALTLARWPDEPVPVAQIERYLDRVLKQSQAPAYHGSGYCVDMIRILGEQGRESSLHVLRHAAKHGHSYVRAEAERAIANIEGKGKKGASGRGSECSRPSIRMESRTIVF